MRHLIALLLFLEPLHFAAEALRVLPTLPYRGAVAVFELVVHGLFAAIAAGGAAALLNGAPAAPRVATIAVILSVGRVLQSLFWSVLPGDTVPGEAAYSATVAVLVGLLMIVGINRRKTAVRPR